jgi:hypothetical protein
MQVSSTRDQSAGLTLGVQATIAAAASLRGDTVCTSGRLTAFDGVSIREPPLDFPPRAAETILDFRGVSEFFRVINFQNRKWKSHTLVHGFTPQLPRGPAPGALPRIDF